MRLNTQVGIVGAGPAGLMLGHLLHLNGIDSVIVENRSREYVIDRVRAGVLEHGTVDLLHAMGVGANLQRHGLRHDGVYISFQGQRHHINLTELTGGKAITVYGQNEVVKDLIEARIAITKCARSKSSVQRCQVSIFWKASEPVRKTSGTSGPRSLRISASVS